LYRYWLQFLPDSLRHAACITLHFNNIASGNQAAINSNETGSAITPSGRKRRTKMLYYALVFLLIAIIAAVFGFGGVAIVSAGIAKILFFVFIVLFLVSLITHMSRRV
jgi:uncharacterized membrane protein YtjA (UPF0391 family)